MGRVTARLPVTKVRYADPPGARRRADVVAVEEPLEVRAGGQVLTVTMRTPGDDLDLVHGWLLAEGVLRRAEDLRTARYCAGAVETGPDGTPQNTYNVLDVDLAPEALAAVPAAQRLGLTSSACGVCGSASIEVLAAKLPGGGLADVDTTLDIATIPELVEGLGAAQRAFAKTGGTHAAALYGAGGELRSAAEDVGRHNAVDKVIGAALRAGAEVPFGGILLVSSRASFEIVQKAAMAGVPIVIALSAPSSLAVEAARDLGMTLLAFARGESVNVYVGGERLRPPS